MKDAQIFVNVGWQGRCGTRDKWLVKNGHITGRDKRADKGKCTLAPTHILGYYCGFYAQSTWALWKIFEDSLKGDPETRRASSHGPYMNLIRLITEYFEEVCELTHSSYLLMRDTDKKFHGRKN